MSKRKILLVEDNPTELVILKKALEKSLADCQFDSVDDGIKCIDYLYETAQLPDCIVLDLNLPDQDGRAVLKLLSESEELAKLNVVVLTGSENPEDKSYCNTMKVKGYFLKSLVFNDFSSLIQVLQNFVR